MTDKQIPSAMEVAVQAGVAALGELGLFELFVAEDGQHKIRPRLVADVTRTVVESLGLAAQRQSMPKRLAWAQRTDRPGWYWREDERVECTRLVSPWREVE